jgi:cob(I)alamin adenosyltransferase
VKLYTKTGDEGQTGLIGGQRVAKDHPRVSAYGGVDELNCALGWVIAAMPHPDLNSELQQIQDKLFVLGAELANPDSKVATPSISEADITLLESWIDKASDAVPPLRQFILPGGTEESARLHVARAVCRRAERDVVALSHAETVHESCLIYLNRLSDLLFAWARLANHQAGVDDIPWRSPSS